MVIDNLPCCSRCGQPVILADCYKHRKEIYHPACWEEHQRRTLRDESLNKHLFNRPRSASGRRSRIAKRKDE